MTAVRFSLGTGGLDRLRPSLLPTTGVVATVFPANRRTEALWKNDRLTVTVPIGGTRSVANLPSGRYIIECHVPGGEAWQREFTVADTVLDVALLDDERASTDPGSRPGWGVGRSPIELGSGSLRMFKLVSGWDPRERDAARAPNADAALFDWSDPSRRTDRRDVLHDRSLTSLEPWIRWRVHVGSVPLFPQPLGGGWELPVPVPPEDGMSVLVTVRTGSQAWVAAVPAVRDPSVRQSVLVDVDPTRPTSGGHPPVVDLGARQLEPLLGYLADSSFTLARSAVLHAEDLLYGKRREPISAAAGAYALVGSLASGDIEGEPWHQWVGNLDRWFPWMSDGPILHARLLLRLAAGRASTDEAASSIVRAVERGLPSYSLGVRWLYESALQLEATHSRVRAFLPVITDLARRVDPSQPFTVLTTTPAGQGTPR